jgi:hypothetical protein
LGDTAASEAGRRTGHPCFSPSDHCPAVFAMKNLPIWHCLHRRLEDDGSISPPPPVVRSDAPQELPPPIIVPCMHRTSMPMLGPSVGPYYPTIDATAPR